MEKYISILKNNDYWIFERNPIMESMENTISLTKIPKQINIENIKFGYSIDEEQKKEILKLIFKE